MQIDFDSAKDLRNIADRGLSFEQVSGFDFETARFAVDTRRNYGETRHRALGLLAGRVHVLVFVEAASGIRVISFRKANKREVRQYEQASKP